MDAVAAHLQKSLETLKAAAEDAVFRAAVADIASRITQAFRDGHKVMLAGNGGSAADAQHLVAEFVGRLCDDRPAMRAVALTTDSSILTAVANDYGFERVFSRQIEALGHAGDVFMAISTSGTSPNILRALERAKQMGITTIGLSGATTGKMRPHCDYYVRIPSDVTMHIQQAHLALEHIFCEMVERLYFGNECSSAHSAPVAGKD